jgi:hypothetical protein
MPEYIGKTKGFGNEVNDVPFNTYVPALGDNADIQNAFELFYFGDSTFGTAIGDVSLHATIVDFDSRITTTSNAFSAHESPTSTSHGVLGNIVGTIDIQELTNKTLTSPKINQNVNLTATSTELNVLDGITSSTAELNILDGVTATAAELNILDGVTATAAELNILDGVIATAAELNILGGVTATAAELNILDGVTATAAELNYVDGVTSNIQTQINSKAASSALSSHEADTTSIHGIVDTSKLAKVASSSAGRTIFVQSATPTALATGDIWFQVTGL